MEKLNNENRFNKIISSSVTRDSILHTDFRPWFPASMILHTMKDIFIPFIEKDKNLDWYYDKVKSYYDLDIKNNAKHELLWEIYMKTLDDMGLISCEVRWMFPTSIEWSDKSISDLTELANNQE